MRPAAFIAVFTAGLSAAARSAPLRVDVNINQQRSDILTREWENWLIPDGGTKAEQQFGAVKASLIAADDGTLAGVWWKGGLPRGATVASDGVTVKNGTMLELVLSGLTSGRHSIVTWHNHVSEKDAPAEIKVSTGTASATVQPTLMVKNDREAASTFLEFEAEAGKDTVIRMASEGAVILNGFEIDTANPVLKAWGPSPVHYDEHTVENPKLTWQAAQGAAVHLFYLGNSKEAVESATETSPEFRGQLSAAEFQTKDLSHMASYFWRVDEVHPGQREPVKGDVWMFRTRFPAFPTAEGYGRFARGGRGGRVMEVSNLNDSGPGSLREAIEAEGPRTVVFRVSGLISLESGLRIRNPYLTIAGQTAPGEGICLRNYGCGTMGAHDVIIRHLRVRVGDAARKGMDGMGFASSDHCILDHCTISWTSDEGFSSRAAKNITVQRCIISEALQYSFHYKASDRSKFAPHAFGASISGDVGSFHHNLLAHCTDRNWSLAGGYDADGQYAGHLDIRNNVVFNWTKRTTDGGVMRLNYVNNFYKPVPSNNPVRWLLKLDPIQLSAGVPQYFMQGNVLEGTEDGSDNWRAFTGNADVQKLVRSDRELFPSYLKPQTAQQACESVLADVGANKPASDVIDQRIISEVRDGKTTYIGSKAATYDPPGKNTPGIIDTPSDVKDAADSPNAPWPAYKSAEPPADNDHDGMPDAWEQKAGLDANDAKDGNEDRDGDGYTNLEEFLGWLCGEFTDPGP
jgi:hypothetical protein